MAERLHACAQKRLSVLQTSNAWRLHDAQADAVCGATIECFDRYAVINDYGAADIDSVAGALQELGALGVYVKQRLKTDLRRASREQAAPEQPLRGQPAPFEFAVDEGELRYLVRLADGLSTGLFLDQRENRRRLQGDVQGARVLNLFCYTGSFSIAAVAGGAEQVTSVDLSATALRRVDANIQLNNQQPSRHRLLKADASSWLARAVKRGDKYDWIVLDPPSFASIGKQTFSVAKDYEALAKLCLQLLSPSGRLLAVTNHRQTSRQQFEQTLRSAMNDEQLSGQLEWLQPPIDCATGPDADLATKSVLVRVGKSGR